MTESEAQIEEQALRYARANGKALARKIASTDVYLSEECPVSVFMAGSPGAGKTEASIELLSTIATEQILRIDPDELRAEFQGYDGKNAWLFQRAASVLVEKIHDFALKKQQSFLLDGTLSSYKVAEKNIQRSIDKGRTVQILYVYQEPQSAWRFVKARELREGRRIEPETFVNQYFAAREVVHALKLKFGQGVKIDLLLKNLDGSKRLYQANVDQIDSYVPEKFSRQQVTDIVSQ